MQFRWWNSFTVLSVILIAISVIGMVAGERMVFDPGRPASGREWLLYLLAGVLMLVNGLLPSSQDGGGGGAAREDTGKRGAEKEIS